jgi:aspartate racemase
MSSSMKTIGLLGGMSWESTAFYYRILNQEAARRLGGLHSAPLILHSLDFAPIARMQAEGRWTEAGAVLNTAARGLVGAGAQVLGLATNTMHLVADGMLAGIGTRFSMEKSFYLDRLAARGLTALVPDVDHTNLNGIIYDELCKGIVRDESRRVYQDAIARLAARGAQAVILGCTEICMLIDDSTSPLPTYDTTDLHARALVAAALDG